MSDFSHFTDEVNSSGDEPIIPLDGSTAARYHGGVIRSFRCKETERIFNGEDSPGFPPAIQPKARLKLRMIDSATSLRDLLIPPGNRLEALKGNRAGQHSIRINDQWRICFVWENGAHRVEIVDYH